MQNLMNIQNALINIKDLIEEAIIKTGTNE